MLSERQLLRMGQFYHNILDLAVKINITTSQEERNYLIVALERATKEALGEPECLFLAAAIGYIEDLSDE